MSKSNLHRFPKPITVYHPAEGERLQDGEASQVDYDIRIHLEGLAETSESNEDFDARGAPCWFSTIIMFLIGLLTGVFITSSALSP